MKKKTIIESPPGEITAYQNYIKALEEAIEAGAKYEDLLKMDPREFNLPEQENKNAIFEAIGNAFNLTYKIPQNEENAEFNYHLFSFVPGLSVIAEDIGAPLSVIMDCYFYVRGI